ncbi:MAG: DUF2891 domain-containing protein [Chloroflexia bacterium]
MELTPEMASGFAGLALRGVRREYPNKLDHVINGPEDVRSPRDLHPAFYGCFDWHSSVHSHWTLLRLLRLFPGLPEAGDIRAVMDEHLSEENLLAERAYVEQPNRRSFERMYGWAWLLKLAEELHAWDDPQAQQWARNLQPLAEWFVERYLEFLPAQTYPIRAGTHPNTAFGLAFALDYARSTGLVSLEQLVISRVLDYYASDQNCPADREPGGSDFLSPCLVEADLMRRVLPPEEFGSWLERFLPGLPAGEPLSIFSPAQVSDRTDPQIVHLVGLNLSRAWCMNGIASAFDAGNPPARVLREAAELHARAGLPLVAGGDYMGEHWLATFALYMLATP